MVIVSRYSGACFIGTLIQISGSKRTKQGYVPLWYRVKWRLEWEPNEMRQGSVQGRMSRSIRMQMWL